MKFNGTPGDSSINNWMAFADMNDYRERVSYDNADGLPDVSKLFEVGKSSPKETVGKQAASANNGSTNPAKANTTQSEVPPPTEAYNRLKHYGKTPTSTDRKALGATSGQDVDHTISLVKHYYEGDGTAGCKPGYTQSPAQRRQFAQNRSNMKVVPSSENKSGGGKLSQYSKNKKKQHGLNTNSDTKKKT